MQPGYGEPPGGPKVGDRSIVIMNQTQPQVVNVMNSNFGTKPVSLTCQFCKTPITTHVKKTFDCCSCLLCLFTSFLIWLCVQCCRDKEINCWDAKHTCPNCGQVLRYYNSC